MKFVVLTNTLLLLFVFIVAQHVHSADIDKGLVAYWAFNDKSGDTASDSTGNGHDGMLIGDPKWVDGYFGGGIELDQAGDEVNVPFHKDLNPEVFTICAWANVEQGSGGHRAVVSSRDEPPTAGYIIYALPANTWQFWTGNGGNPNWVPIQGPAVNLGDWDHVAGVFEDGKQMFYVNGELAGETDSNPTFNAQQEFLIGAGANERANHEYLFKGIIDEVRLYNRVLDEDEINAVMNSESLAVEASGKIAVTWGHLKAK